MLDADLAALYGVQTKVLNRAVKRNQFRMGFSGTTGSLRLRCAVYGARMA